VNNEELPRTRRGQAAYRRRLRFQAEVLLMNNLIAELAAGNVTGIKQPPRLRAPSGAVTGPLRGC